MQKVESVFDILGPTMVGPSSSHTVGALRLARVAADIKGEFDSVHIILHGSFAETGHGHGTDEAILAGLMGFEVDDECIRHAVKHARKMPWKFSFECADLGADKHPNTVRFIFKSDGKVFAVEGASIGGGKIRITEIDGISISASFNHPTLILKHGDEAGSLAKILDIIARTEVNASSVNSWPEIKGKMAVAVIELDEPLKPKVVEEISKLENVTWVEYVDVDWRGFA